MATAEHREPSESRGSRTVLGARGGAIPPRNSTRDAWMSRMREVLPLKSVPLSPATGLFTIALTRWVAADLITYLPICASTRLSPLLVP